MSFAKKTARAALLVPCLLLIHACASIPSAGIDGPDKDKLPTNGGLVAVQVVTNSAHLTDALVNWTEAIVVKEDGVGKDGQPELFSLPALDDGLTSTRVFVGLLAPGHYRFSGLFSYARGGDMTYMLSARAPRTVGTFDVQTDRLTNLGTVLFQPFHPDPLANTAVLSPVETPYAMSRIDDSQPLAEFVAAKYPRQFERTRSATTLGWTADTETQARTRLAEAIHGFAFMERPRYISREEIIYTARLGSLYRRSASGQWTIGHLPTNLALMSATKLSDGSYVAGGERGTVWHAGSLDGSWQAATLPYAGQSTAWLGEVDGKLFAIGMDNGKARLYQRGEDWAWKLVGEYGTRAKEGARELAYDYSLTPRVVTRGKELLVYGDHARYRLDAATAAFSKIDDQGSFLVQEQPNGIIVSNADSFWFGGVGAPQISRDGGLTWEPYHRLGKWGGALYVFSDGTPLAIDSDTGFGWKGWEKEPHPSVLTSSDKGKTQRAIGQVTFGCNRIEGPISTDELLYLYCFDGSLLKSTDRGRTWGAEYSRAVRADKLPAEFLGPGAKK
ncbi:MAG: hypothetical protein JSS42_09735 [Proteobacteria bacterium]|uniref:hypothetical protein n=1 Tax=Rudaea sp. TaxID=2136325 RepID=UPI00322081BE|nr:hypothetical protein [Pseudomonadota bacterium]